MRSVMRSVLEAAEPGADPGAMPEKTKCSGGGISIFEGSSWFDMVLQCSFPLSLSKFAWLYLAQCDSTSQRQIGHVLCSASQRRRHSRWNCETHITGLHVDGNEASRTCRVRTGQGTRGWQARHRRSRMMTTVLMLFNASTKLHPAQPRI